MLCSVMGQKLIKDLKMGSLTLVNGWIFTKILAVIFLGMLKLNFEIKQKINYEKEMIFF